jgi:hypothetical protein
MKGFESAGVAQRFLSLHDLRCPSLPVLPERESQPFLDNIEHGMKRPVLGALKAGWAQQDKIAGRVGQVDGTPSGTVLANDEPSATLQDKDGDEVDRPGAVPMRREAERAGRVTVQGGVGKA